MCVCVCVCVNDDSCRQSKTTLNCNCGQNSEKKKTSYLLTAADLGNKVLSTEILNLFNLSLYFKSLTVKLLSCLLSFHSENQERLL